MKNKDKFILIYLKGSTSLKEYCLSMSTFVNFTLHPNKHTISKCAYSKFKNTKTCLIRKQYTKKLIIEN